MPRAAALARPFPTLLLVGALLLIIFQAAYFADVLNLTRGTVLYWYTVVVRANITPLAWCAYLLFLLGLLTWLDRASYLRRFRNRFVICWLWSIPAWCYFDWMNFYFMRDPHTGLRAWEYVNLPASVTDRFIGYLFAFGAIAPGMFLSAEVFQRLLFRGVRIGGAWSAHARRVAAGLVFVLGLALAPIPIVIGTPASNLALWVGTWALLDPINLWCGRPSILGDWSRGRWGRTFALGAGGLVCGFLWEFWNYWSYTKWVYHLPFLGPLQSVKYFEMPVPGLIGFVAFGIETWTMWQTALLLLSWFVEGEHRPAVEANRALQDYGCF